MKLNKNDYNEEELQTMLDGGTYYICSGSDEIYDDEDDGVYIHDDWYSYEYLEGSYDFYQCSDCGRWIANDDGIYIQNDGVDICEDCYNNGCYYRCEDCGDVYSGDGNWTDDDRVLCDGCYDDYYYNNDDNDRRIYSYHNFKDWTPFKLDGEVSPYFIGFELEIVCKNRANTSRILDAFEDAWPVVFMEDGSLDDGGVEIISHPFSIRYFEKNKNKLKEAFKKAVELGAISHDARCCGLHFHFTRPKKDDAINRMWLVLETYKQQVIKLSRRDEQSFNHWTAMLSGGRDDLKTKTLDYIDEHKKDCGRYKALNNTNTKTIEFRLFRGTLNFDTFVASLEFVNNLYKACISSKDLCKINWQYLTKSKSINNYIKLNNITSNKIVKDFGVEYNKLLQKASKHLNNAIILLKQGYNEELQKIEKINVLREDVEVTITNLNNLQQFLKYLNNCKYYKDFNNFNDFNYYLKNACNCLDNYELKTKINYEADVIDKFIEGGI